MREFNNGTIWVGIIAGGMAQSKTTSAFQNGLLTRSEYAAYTTKNITGTLGLMTGIEYGALIGTTLLPGAGTVLGTIIGGVLGNGLGNTIGLELGYRFFNNQIKKQQPITYIAQ